MERPHPIVLAILDGWGIAPAGDGNAIRAARTPNMDRFVREYPAMSLYASSVEVGLSSGEMGNSEVGHLNIGAGRVYYQSAPRISSAIADDSFFANSAFVAAADHTKKHRSRLHLVGLVSPGNVHASEEHCYALLEFAKRQKIKDVFVHVILDGRDTTYNSGIDFVRRLQEKMKEAKRGAIASVSGRFYAMDRDNRWDRIEAAYRAMAEGVAAGYEEDPIQAIEASYANKVYDEEFVPIVIGREGAPVGRVADGDAVIFFNFRPDRARELTKAFILPGFSKFNRHTIERLFFVTMTEYEKEIPVTVAFPPVVIHRCLAEVLSENGLKQLHIAETEKYAHITFFLNGTVEAPFAGEDRKIIPSPPVASYAEVPEMSARDIAKEVVKAVESDAYDAIFVNFANADMVGHTGDAAATMKGCETVDECLGDIASHTLAKGGVLLITADHGNAEEMVNLQTGTRDKEHSTNPVPFLVVGDAYKGQAGAGGDAPEGDLSLMHPVGVLADVAPTMLSVMGIDPPEEMVGRPLL
jgi:2,3-bisphosphoglycerate-independent phosphoglycerate mutase